MLAVTETPTTPSTCLQYCGWKHVKGDDLRLGIKTPSGIVTAFPQSLSSEWQTWSFTGIGRKQRGHHKTELLANQDLDGPFKVLRAATGELDYRADLPRDVIHAPAEMDFVSGTISSPLMSWAKFVTASVSGQPLADSSSTFTTDRIAALVEKLTQQGWVASADGDDIKVTIPLPSKFCEVAIRQRGQEVRVTSEAVDLRGFEEQSLSAVQLFAEEANARLQLLRFAYAGDEGRRERILMEVRTSATGLDGWLPSVLEVLRTAVQVCVRPMASLRDPSVAKLFLAAHAVGRKEVP